MNNLAEESSSTNSQKRHTLLKLDLESVFVPHQHHASMDSSRFEEEFCREQHEDWMIVKSVGSPQQSMEISSPKQTSSPQAIPVQKSKKSSGNSKSNKSVSGSPLLKLFNSQCDAESEEEKEESLVRKTKNTAHNVLLHNTYFSPQKSTATVTDSELFYNTSPLQNATTSPSPRSVVSPTAPSSSEISPTIKEEEKDHSFKSETLASRGRSHSIGNDSRAIKHKVKSVLMDNERRTAFKQLCEKEFSNENYKMFFHVQQSMKLLEHQILLVDKMDTLIQNELNLESEQRNKLVNCIQRAETEFSVFEQTLHQLEELMLTNMSDTYLRFVGQGLSNSSQGLSPRNAESKIMSNSSRSNSLIQQNSPRRNSFVNNVNNSTSPRNVESNVNNGESKHSRSKPISQVTTIRFCNYHLSSLLQVPCEHSYTFF